MHDPMVVVFRLSRPWPQRPRRLSRTKARFKTHFPFVRKFGWQLYFPPMVTFWHVEPGDADSGKVCGHHPHAGAARLRWIWRHRGHLSVQVHGWQMLCRRIWSRCAECGKPFRGDNRMVIGTWNGDGGPGWRKRERDVRHERCAALVRSKQQLSEARRAIEVAGLTSETLQLLGMPHTDAWRVMYDLEKGREWEAAQAAKAAKAGA